MNISKHLFIRWTSCSRITFPKESGSVILNPHSIFSAFSLMFSCLLLLSRPVPISCKVLRLRFLVVCSLHLILLFYWWVFLQSFDAYPEMRLEFQRPSKGYYQIRRVIILFCLDLNGWTFFLTSGNLPRNYFYTG